MDSSGDLVFDSWAILSLLNKEKFGDQVKTLIGDTISANGRCYMSVINWGELRYSIARTSGSKKMHDACFLLDEIGFEIIYVDRNRASIAAQIKARGGLSYADAYAAALAMELEIPLVTGDKEFLQLQPELELVFLG